MYCVCLCSHTAVESGHRHRSTGACFLLRAPISSQAQAAVLHDSKSSRAGCVSRAVHGMLKHVRLCVCVCMCVTGSTCDLIYDINMYCVRTVRGVYTRVGDIQRPGAGRPGHTGCVTHHTQHTHTHTHTQAWCETDHLLYPTGWACMLVLDHVCTACCTAAGEVDETACIWVSYSNIAIQVRYHHAAHTHVCWYEV